MKRDTRFQILFFTALLGGSLLLSSVAEAKSVSWNHQENKLLEYYGTRNSGGVIGYGPAVDDANVTVSYGASMYNADTGTLLNDGDSLPVGSRVRFVPKAYQDSDIFWFGTGQSWDSPNGRWINGAAAPGVACVAQDYINDAEFDGSHSGPDARVYIPLSVNPPGTSISVAGSTAALTDLGGGVYRVDGSGTIRGTVTFNATNGAFYYRYYSLRDGTGCVYDNHALSFEYDTGEQDCAWLPYQPPYCDEWSYLTGCSPERPAGTYCSPRMARADYSLSVPQQNIVFTLNVPSNNNAPNAPTIDSSFNGAMYANTAYSFDFNASDPDGDNIAYGIDLDMNGTDDTGSPYGTPIPSGTTQRIDMGPWSAGTHTIQARTFDTKGGISGWAQHTFTVSTPPSPLSANLTINGSDGPLEVALGTPLNLSWSSVSAVSCTSWGSGWGTGNPVAPTGSASTSANASDTYILQCTDGINTATDFVQVNLTNSLKLCQSNCSSGILRGANGAAGSFTLAQGGTQTLVTCFNASSTCNDASGDVTESASWSEGGGNVISLSGVSPKTVSGDNAGGESVSATYSGQTATSNVTVTCLPTVSCANAPGQGNYCEGQTFTVDNGCGVSITCNGTKSCNYNWREVAP